MYYSRDCGQVMLSKNKFLYHLQLVKGCNFLVIKTKFQPQKSGQPLRFCQGVLSNICVISVVDKPAQSSAPGLSASRLPASTTFCSFFM